MCVPIPVQYSTVKLGGGAQMVEVVAFVPS